MTRIAEALFVLKFTFENMENSKFTLYLIILKLKR
jgi:hypothetical protein